uniref:Uncharacterized protein n=1 Tax=Vitrella brassicaformis TaxID=1169539 RepID=A0A7S1KI75_9ALVE
MLHGLGEEGPLEVLRQKAVDDTRTYRQTKKRKRMMLDADTSDQPSTRRLKKDPTTGQYHVQPIQKVDALAAVQSRQTPDQLADLVITTFTAPNSASILKTIPKHAPSERPVLTHPFGTADGSKNGPLPLPLPAHPEAEQKEILMDGEDDAQMAVDSVPPAAAAAASGEDQLMAEAPQQGEEQQPSAVALWAESRQQQQQQQQGRPRKTRHRRQRQPRLLRRKRRLQRKRRLRRCLCRRYAVPLWLCMSGFARSSTSSLQPLPPTAHQHSAARISSTLPVSTICHPW